MKNCKIHSIKEKEWISKIDGSKFHFNEYDNVNCGTGSNIKLDLPKEKYPYYLKCINCECKTMKDYEN